MAAPAVTMRTTAAELPRRRVGFWSDALHRIRHDPVTMGALGVLTVMVLLAVSAELLAQHVFRFTFTQQDLLRTWEKPTLDEPAYWLGGDNLGRSQIVRIMYGARISLFIGVFGALVSMGMGLALGVTSGYFRGWWDDVVVWLVTTLSNIPILFLLIMIGLYFRLDALSLSILIGLLGWLGIANFARGQTIALRDREYVQAARAVGATAPRIMLRHIFPNIVPLMIVLAMVDIGGIILAESALSYLGFGVQPPQPSWGNMLSGATAFYFKGPHLIVVPGVAITVTVLCLYLVGDGLRDAFDPRLRGSSGVRHGGGKE
ncbi:ABC transporter permease [soil metagenome]